MIKYTISNTNQIPPEGYSNTNDATSREGKKRNKRSRNHSNISRRNNQPKNRPLASFTGEVPPVGAVLETVSEQRITKDHFNNFQDNVKNMYYGISII